MKRDLPQQSHEKRPFPEEMINTVSEPRGAIRKIVRIDNMDCRK